MPMVTPSRQLSVAKPNVFSESSDAPGREHNNQKGAHGGNWFPP